MQSFDKCCFNLLSRIYYSTLEYLLYFSFQKYLHSTYFQELHHKRQWISIYSGLRRNCFGKLRKTRNVIYLFRNWKLIFFFFVISDKSRGISYNIRFSISVNDFSNSIFAFIKPQLLRGLKIIEDASGRMW